MSPVSRLVARDCRIPVVQARHSPTSCFSSSSKISFRAPKASFGLPDNERSSCAKIQPGSLFVPLKLTSSVINTMRVSPVLCKAASGEVPVRTTYENVVEVLTTMFPVWVIVGTIIGIYKPAAVTWLQTDLFTVCLGFLMLSMGLTLTFEDFRRCLRNPWTVGVGFLAQYLIKPVLGFLEWKYNFKKTNFFEIQEIQVIRPEEDTQIR